jgi:hypothetical protein
MAVEKSANTEKNYNYLNGGFRGLFTAQDPHLIPDGYLAAMTNMEVDEQGVIRAVHPPITTSAPAEREIQYCGCPIWQAYGTAYTSAGTMVNTMTTLAAADSFSADADIYESSTGYDWTVYLNRFYYNIGNVLRYSGVSKAHLSKTWTGANAYNFQVFPYGITHLQPLQSGLYVIGEGVISRLTEPKTGSTSEVYYGPRTPVSDGVTSYMLNNGSAIFYCGQDGTYGYGGGGDPERIDPVLTHATAITKFFVAEYKNRIWVMQDNGLFAMNKTTGFWEYYDPSTMVTGQAFWKLGWPRTQSVKTLDIFGGTMGGVGQWYNFTMLAADTGARMPWTFTTKDYTPSFDAYSRVVRVKFYYLGQAASSTATIQVYGDGTLVDTVTQDMAGTGLLHKDYRCVGTLANSFHLVVSGTGKADIVDVGIEFTPRMKGDPNDVT